ncbi:MAG TPA: alpha/beta hydrolase [Polyangia bacterium]
MRKLPWTVGVALLSLVALALLGVRCDRSAADVEARLATPPSRFFEVDGLRVHYRDRGTGPAIVLLHGSNSSLFTWEGWAADLARDHRVVTLDLPGHGLTGPDPRERYRPADMAAFVDAFVAALGLPRFSIGGNSMGGGVAWRYALLHPDKVERLILVDSAGQPRQEPQPFAFRLFTMPGAGRLVRWISPRFVVAKSLRDAYGDPGRVTDRLIDLYDDILLRAGNREATRRRFRAGSDDGMVARLGELHVPTLILWGSRDRFILPKYGERFRAAIAGSELVVLDGLGHVPMEEDPQRSVAEARRFLARK